MPYVHSQGVRIHYQTEGEGPPLVLQDARADTRASGLDWRARFDPMSKTPLGTVVGNLAHAAPHRAALTCGTDTVSRAALEARTNRLARAYRELGVTPDSFVTIGLPNSIEFFEAVLAVWKLGATPQPISSRLPTAERCAIIDLANPSLVVGVEPSETPGRTTIPGGFQPEASLSSDPLPPADRRVVQGADVGRKHRPTEAHRRHPVRDVGVGRGLRKPAADPSGRRAPGDRTALPQRPVRHFAARATPGQSPRDHGALRRRPRRWR